MKHILLPMSIALLISSCGGSKNPMEKYPNIKNDIVPINNNNEKEQRFKSGCKSMAVAERPALIAPEGQTSAMSVFIRGPLVNPNENLIVSNPPPGLEHPIKVKPGSEGLKFELRYTPPKGIVDQGKSFKNFSVELFPESQKDQSEKCPTQIEIFATTNISVPSISDVKIVPENSKLSTAHTVSVTIDAKVENLENINNLSLVIESDTSGDSRENPKIDLRQSLKYKINPSKIGNNIYRFIIEFDKGIIESKINDYLNQQSHYIEMNPGKKIEGVFSVILINHEFQPSLSSPSQNITIPFIDDKTAKKLSPLKPAVAAAIAPAAAAPAAPARVVNDPAPAAVAKPASSAPSTASSKAVAAAVSTKPKSSTLDKKNIKKRK